MSAEERALLYASLGYERALRAVGLLILLGSLALCFWSFVQVGARLGGEATLSESLAPLALGAGAGLGALLGEALRRLRPEARGPLLLGGLLVCAWFPYGTIGGAYLVWLLLSPGASAVLSERQVAPRVSSS